MNYRQTFDHLGNPVYRKPKTKLVLTYVVAVVGMLVAAAVKALA